MDRWNFLEQFTLKESSYRLSALVRNTGAHFACALLSENKWIYFDDLKQDRIFYVTLNEMQIL